MGKRRSNYMGQQACRLLPAMVTSIQVSVMDVELFSMIVEAMGYRACGTQARIHRRDGSCWSDQS